jgi:hypothetical protein
VGQVDFIARVGATASAMSALNAWRLDGIGVDLVVRR